MPGFVVRKLAPADAPGLRWAATMAVARLGPRVLPAPEPGRVGLIAAWHDDRALDRFLEEHPMAAPLEGGWHVRLDPLRASGAWSAVPELQQAQGGTAADDDPVGVVTLGRLRLLRMLPFLRTNAPAAGQAVADPAMLVGTGLTRPPRLVATFSLWRSLAAMRDYAYGRSGPWHDAAARAHAERPFHHESIFARFRPYGARGTWEGDEPLAAVTS